MTTGENLNNGLEYCRTGSIWMPEFSFNFHVDNIKSNIISEFFM